MASVSQYKKILKMKSRVSPFKELFGNDFLLPDIKALIKTVSEESVISLLSNDKVVAALAAMAAEMIPTPKDGEPGSNGENGKPGYTPKKGIDYFTEDEAKSFLKKISKSVRQGEDGKTPVKYLDYFTADEIKEISEKTADRVLETFTGAEVVKKINDLPIKPELQIDAKHIKNLPKESKRVGATLHRGGLKLAWNVELDGTIDGVNNIFTVPASQPDPKDDKYIVSARGVLKTVEGGDFSVSNNNRTITFTIAPPNGSGRPRIILYHGK